MSNNIAELLPELLTATRPLRPLLAAAAVAALLAHFYVRHVLLPAPLRGLPYLGPPTILRLAAARMPYLDFFKAQMDALQRMAVQLGAIANATDTPAAWCTWVFGSHIVMIANPEDARAAVVGSEESLPLRRVTWGELGLKTHEALMGNSLVTTMGVPWKKHHGVLLPSFRRGFPADLFAPPSRQLLAHFDAHAVAGSTVDVDDYMQRLTLDALSGILFASSFDAINKPNSHMLTLYNDVRAFLFHPVYTALGTLAAYTPAGRRARAKVHAFSQCLKDLVTERAAEMQERRKNGTEAPVDGRDLLERMIEASEAGLMSDEEIRSNMVGFFVAGHDTTATTLTYAIYMLGYHKDIQDKARAEALALMGTRSVDVSNAQGAEHAIYPTNDQANKLTYLTMVIKETMRLFPAVNALPFRRASRDVKLSTGHVIPRGTVVSIHILAMQRAKQFYGEDADTFRPERWAKPATAATASQATAIAADEEDEQLTAATEGTAVPLSASANGYMWMPFSAGPHACIGQQFSITEQRVLLAMMLARYEWDIMGDEHALAGKPLSRRGMLLHPEGIHVVFRRRGAAREE
ncbi:cytochrome P450 [Blastocladiella britannica]|nr:cytochrome P450 [Blastocladiella britannica]